MKHQVNRDSLFQAKTMLPETDALKQSKALSNLNDRYIVHVWSRWTKQASDFAKEVEAKGSTLFQSDLWLTTWYETFATDARTKAVIVALEDTRTSELVMVLPLCRRMENGLAIISFADFGIADYNAPLLHPDWRPEDQHMGALMRQICKALPRADLLKLEKLPAYINTIKNPLTQISGVQESNLCHFGIEVTGSWDDYWATLKRNFRKDQRRRWRVLEKKGNVEFVWCREDQEVLSLFATLREQQRRRLLGLDLVCRLDDPLVHQFYEKIITKGCQDGSIIFTALLVDGKAVATLCGFGDGTRYAMTLSGYEAGDWAKSSPGRLLTERTMQVLHENGYSYFDFTIGDEPYKKYFAMEHGPLLEYYRPLNWKALLHYSWMKLKAAQRKSEWAGVLKKLIGKNNTPK